MAQYRRTAPAPPHPAAAPAPPPLPAPPGLTPEQQALLIQQWMFLNQRPPANPWLEGARGVLSSLCNSQGGYYAQDGQCLRPTPPPPQTWQCRQIGDATNCSAF